MAGAARWLWAGVAVGCGLAVLLSPTARWHVVDGLFFGLNEVPVWQRAVSQHLSVGVEPTVPEEEEHIFSYWLAVATMTTGEPRKEQDAALVRERIRALEELLERFPHRVSLHAHLGRYYAAAVSIGGENEQDDAWRATPHDWERLRDLMAEGSRRQPNNAFFIQMLAAAYMGLGQPEKAQEQWEIAADKTQWRDYAEEEVFAQWDLLERIHGQRGARQRFPAIAMLRLPHPALIEETATALLKRVTAQGSRAEQVRLRLLNARNGALLREQARQVVAGLVGIGIVETAIEWGDTKTASSPRLAEERRAEFRRVLRDTLPPAEAQVQDRFVVMQARRNDGYRAQIPQISAMEFSGWNTVSGGPELWTGWLFRSIATSALVDGSFGLLVRFLLAWAFAASVLVLSARLRLSLPERLRATLAVLCGLAVGLVAYLGSGSWAVGVWYSLLIGTFGYAASASDAPTGANPAGTAYLTWTRTHAVWAWLMAIGLVVLGLLSFIFRYADFAGVHLALTGVAPPAPNLSVQQWAALGWFVISLPIALSVYWAARSGASLIPSAAEGLARIASIGAAVCAVTFLFVLPLCIVRDREDVTRLELIARNEPNYYRRAAAPVSAGYHESSTREGIPSNSVGDTNP